MTSFDIQITNIFQYFLDLFFSVLYAMQSLYKVKQLKIENFCHFDLMEDNGERKIAIYGCASNKPVMLLLLCSVFTCNWRLYKERALDRYSNFEIESSGYYSCM